MKFNYISQKDKKINHILLQSYIINIDDVFYFKLNKDTNNIGVLSHADYISIDYKNELDLIFDWEKILNKTGL